jgi:hypothetical protein
MPMVWQARRGVDRTNQQPCSVAMNRSHERISKAISRHVVTRIFPKSSAAKSMRMRGAPIERCLDQAVQIAELRVPSRIMGDLRRGGH